MKTKTILLILLTLLLGLAACNPNAADETNSETETAVPTETPPESDITDETAVPDDLLGVWYWLAFEDSADGTENNDITVSDPTNYTLDFLADGTVNIKADCNNASSQATIEGSSLTFAQGPMTLVECESGSLYNEFLAKLGDVVTYVFDDEGNLVLNLKSDSGNMILSRDDAAQAETAVPDELLGVWHWLAFEDSADGTESNDITVSDPTNYTLDFLADGTVNIKADCNDASSQATIEGGSLTFATGPMTLVECESGSLYNEFLMQLGDVVTYLFDDNDNLVLNLMMDAGNMVFSREEMIASSFQDITWQWVSGPAQPGSSEIITIENPELYQVTYRADGTIEIVADCNQASMSYELRQGGLNGSMLATPGPMTLAECGSDSHYQSFISSLEAAQDYRVSLGGDQMELILPAGGGTLSFVAVP